MTSPMRALVWGRSRRSPGLLAAVAESSGTRLRFILWNWIRFNCATFTYLVSRALAPEQSGRGVGESLGLTVQSFFTLSKH